MPAGEAVPSESLEQVTQSRHRHQPRQQFGLAHNLAQDSYTACRQACTFVERNLFRFTERIEIRSTTAERLAFLVQP